MTQSNRAKIRLPGLQTKPSTDASEDSHLPVWPTTSPENPSGLFCVYDPGFESLFFSPYLAENFSIYSRLFTHSSHSLGRLLAHVFIIGRQNKKIKNKKQDFVNIGLCY